MELLKVIKRMARGAAGIAARCRIVDILERFDARRPNLLGVLMYHRVAEPGDAPLLRPNVLSATPRAFQEQMACLAAHYQVVSMEEVLAAQQGEADLPPRSVLITFDDAYRDFAEYAWPILRRYGLPATLFVPTGFPDQPQKAFWWDRLHQAFCTTLRRGRLDTSAGRMALGTARQRARACIRTIDHVKALPHQAAMRLVDELCDELGAPAAENHVLDWDTLRRLAGEAVTLGAHTRNHPLMHRVSVKEAVAEALGSLGDLQREIGPVLPIFAYPGGGFDDRVVDALGRAGFALAFTTQRGLNDLRACDPLRLRRIHVGRQTTLAVLRMRLLRLANAQAAKQESRP